MTDTELLVRDCLASYAEEAELVDLVRAAKSQSRSQSRSRGRRASLWRSRRFLAITATAAVVVLIGVAFLVGGYRATTVHQGAVQGVQPLRHQSDQAMGRVPLPRHSGRHTFFAPTQNAAKVPNGAGAAGPTTNPPGVSGERVVKTGSMSLTVRQGHVQASVTRLVAIASQVGGYVAQTRTQDIDNSPTGEVTLRVPVAKFEAAITAVQHVGHQTALTTNAHDVTGRFVDLNARLAALQRTRQTYLTILGRATTIGQTLSIQQRIEDVQAQIEQLQGELKVLRNQSADGTLTVDVSEAGSTPPAAHHQSGGIGKAWHDSVSRFSRGFDAIVGVLGPLLLALILLGLAALVIRFALRRTRRVTT
jgi:hypothetical protein